MTGRGPRADIVIPVVFDESVPWEVRDRASFDLSCWVNILVGVIPYVESIADLAELGAAATLLQVSVTSAVDALLAAPRL